MEGNVVASAGMGSQSGHSHANVNTPCAASIHHWDRKQLAYSGLPSYWEIVESRRTVMFRQIAYPAESKKPTMRVAASAMPAERQTGTRAGLAFRMPANSALRGSDNYGH